MDRRTVLSAKLANHLFAEKVEPFFLEHQLNYAGAVIYEVVLDDEDLALELFYVLQENEIGFQDMFSGWLKQQLEKVKIVAQLELDANLTPSQQLPKPA